MQPMKVGEEVFRGQPLIGYMELPPNSQMKPPANLALGVSDGGRQLVVGVIRVVASLGDAAGALPFLPFAYVAVERGNGVVLTPDGNQLAVKIGETSMHAVTVRCLNTLWNGAVFWHELPGQDYVALSVAGRVIAIVAGCDDGTGDRTVKTPSIEALS